MTQPSAIARIDHRIPGDPGLEIAVREVRASHSTGRPLLLVHGGGGGGVASFDSPISGYSLAEDLAGAGRIALTIDLRGWGTSTRPPALDLPPDANPPAVTSDEAVRDIAAVVEWARERHGVEQVDLFGWATGAHWSGMYAAIYPDRVARLALLNGLYGIAAPWSMQAAFADPDNPERFTPAIGAYSYRTAEGLLGAWLRSIPVDDPDEWRDPQVAEAYARVTIEGDPTSRERTPPSVRTPTGFQRDSFYQSRGYRFWEARDITAHTLVMRGSLDFWSRPEDLAALERELTGAASITTRTIENGTHFLFLDRAERGRSEFLTTLIAFLNA